jgi:hypothetical protein
MLAMATWYLGVSLVQEGAPALFILPISAIGWFFMMVGFGGRKGVGVGIWLVVFTGFIFLFWLGFSALLRPNPQTNWENAAYLLLVPASIFTLVFPILFVSKARKEMAKVKKTEGGKNESKASGWREFKIKY